MGRGTKDPQETTTTASGSGSGIAEAVEPVFLLGEYRDAPTFHSLAHIQEKLTEDLVTGSFPRSIIPHVVNLLRNMNQRGIAWANAQFEALYITNETPEEVRNAILKKFDKSNAFQSFRGRGGSFRGNRGRGGRGRGNRGGNNAPNEA